MSPDTIDSLKRALDLARLAPSAHNTQPWRVERTDDVISVHRDDTRHLAHGDPLRRDQSLGLGGFCEALRIGAAAQSLTLEPHEPVGGAFASFRVTSGATPDLEAASLVRRRQSSRLAYSPRPIATGLLESLEAKAKAHGLGLHLVTSDSAERKSFHAWLAAASRESWLDVRAVKELAGWVRFDPEGTRPPEDGLSTHCLALSVAEAAALKVLGRPGLWKALEKVYAAPLLAEELAKADVKQAEQAPCLAVLTGPGPSHDTGAGLFQVWLESTRLGLAIHPISVLLDRRGWEVARHMGVAPRQLLLAFRLGHSVPPPRSGRRPVEAFARV